MARKKGLTISAKMILTSVGLIAFIVVLFAYLNYVNVTKVYRVAAEKQRRTYEKSIRDAGAAQIVAFSEPSKAAMQEENWAAIRQFVVPIKERDPRIVFIWVANSAGKVMASADPEENKRIDKAPEDFYKNPIRKSLVDRRLIPKPNAPKVSKFRIQGDIRQFEGHRVMVMGERLIEQGVYLGSVVLVYSLRQLDELVAGLERQRVRESRAAFMRTAVVGALFLAVGILLAILQGLSISRPIRTLADRATQIAQGDLQARVDVNVGGELGLLAENFNFMADQIVILLNETAAKATMEKELEVARTIQETLVPGDDVVERGGVIQLAGYFEPAAECGGDWWSYVDLAGDKLLVIIGDVTGHGVPSAMITAAAKSAVDTLGFVTQRKMGISYLLENLNKAIYESAKRQFVMTCFATIIDLKTLEIEYGNAGHNFPYLLREENGRPKFSVLMTRGNRLGDILDSQYEAKKEKLQPGDILVWYTDGVVECENERGEEFGEKRFRAAIRRAREKTVGEMREAVMAEAEGFYGAMPRKDDITVVFSKIYAPGQAPPVPDRSQAAGSETAPTEDEGNTGSEQA